MSELEPTKEQRPAIEYPRSLVAIAKPGSGKTFVLARKIQSILQSLPSYKGVIAISFTNKASDELKHRSAGKGIDLKASFFGTIDRFCFSEIIVPFLPHIWGRPSSEIDISRLRDLNEEERLEFDALDHDVLTLEVLESLVPQLKARFLKGQLFLDTAGTLALYTIINSVACQRYLQVRYTHIIIDEYQDSGLVQHDLFIKLHSLGLVAIAVGDADQSIYGFSNKDSKYLLGLASNPDFKTFPITLNHRCHPSITNYSLRFLDAHSSLLETDKLCVYYKACVGNVDAIAKWIDEVLPKFMAEFGVQLHKYVGILVRGNLTGALVNTALTTKHRLVHPHPLEENISLWGGIFSELLRYHFDTQNTVQAIIDRHSFQLTAREVAEARKAIKSIRTCLDGELYSQMEGVASILLPNANKEAPIALLRASTIDDLKRCFGSAEDDEVQIMTIHKSKGLEFDIVFHLDLHEWVLPAKRPGDNNDFDHPVYPSLDQDRNLHYVGVTRARKLCFLCTSTRRTNHQQQEKAGKPSEFFYGNGLEALRVTSEF
jgi:superfamily I DNA/RNA helicase